MIVRDPNKLTFEEYQGLTGELNFVLDKIDKRLAPLTRLLEREGTLEDQELFENVVEQLKMSYLVLGLVGEAGELANKSKKLIRDRNDAPSQEERESNGFELGDVQWYTAELAAFWGVTLQSVASGNLEKLFSRQRRGTMEGSGDNR